MRDCKPIVPPRGALAASLYRLPICGNLGQATVDGATDRKAPKRPIIGTDWEAASSPPARPPRAAPVRQLLLSQTEGTPEAPVWLGCPYRELPRTASTQPEKCPRKCPSLLPAWVKTKNAIEKQGILPPQPSSFLERLLGTVRP